MSYDFRFYGARPGDWFEGANCGHPYEIHFRQPPDAAARAAIAGAFEQALLGSAVDTDCVPWVWAGDWALLFVGEADGEGSFWDGMESAFEAVHKIAPLVEVHYGGTRAAHKNDDWSRWSVAQQACPSEAPDWDGHDLNGDLYGGSIKRVKSKLATDDKFEEARRTARSSAQAGKAQSLLESARKSGRAVLMKVDLSPPAEYQPSSAARAHAVRLAWSRGAPGKRAFALVQDGAGLSAGHRR